MLSFLLALIMFVNLRQGTSLPPRILAREEDPASEPFRTTFDIVWSCFVTIFACVWTSAHPNIPGPRDAGWTKLKRRLIMMAYASIAPEMIVFWAWRQYEAAKWIAKDYNDSFIYSDHPDGPSNVSPENKPILQGFYEQVANSASMAYQSTKQWWTVLPESATWRTRMEPWSQSHGFFIQMGGFVLYENGNPTQVLDYPKFKRLLESKEIDAPLISADDIQDRSKGDAISKGFVVLQTTWFVCQCIARVMRSLPLCELEIVTLGFAVLNAIVYAVCWNKPQGVDACICIPFKDGKAVEEIIDDLIGMAERRRTTTSYSPTMAGHTNVGGAPVQPASQATPLYYPGNNAAISLGAPTNGLAFPLGAIQRPGTQFVGPIVTQPQPQSPPLGSWAAFQNAGVQGVLPAYPRMHNYDGLAHDQQYRNSSSYYPAGPQHLSGPITPLNDDHMHQYAQQGWNHPYPPSISQMTTSPLGSTSRGGECVQQNEHQYFGPSHRQPQTFESTASQHRGQAIDLSEAKSRLESIKQELLEVLKPFPFRSAVEHQDSVSGWLKTQLRQDFCKAPIWRWPLIFLYRCIQFVLRPLGKMAETDTVPKGALRVPMFYAYSPFESQNNAQIDLEEIKPSEEAIQFHSEYVEFLQAQLSETSPSGQTVSSSAQMGLPFIPDPGFMVLMDEQTKQAASQAQSHAYLASCVIGVVFGAVHLLAWSTTFATVTERHLWRISAIVITVVPALVAFGWRWFRYLSVLRKQETLAQLDNKLPGIDHTVKCLQVGIPALLGVPFYVLARFTLLTLALISLRNLPPGVHVDVSWTSFIPHF